MATFRALTINTGSESQIASPDILSVGGGVTTNAGNLVLSAAGTDVQITASKNLSFTGAGTGNVDFSSQSGTFLSPTGVTTIAGVTTFTAAGTAVTVNNNMTVTGTLTAGSIAAAGLIASGLTTTGLATSGTSTYVSAASTLSKTDATAIASSRYFGSYEGTAGQAQIDGVVADALFTTVGGSPSNGAQVYIAALAEEASANGKLTASAYVIGTAVGGFTPAAGNVMAAVGICLDNSSYAGSKTAKVLIQVKPPVVL